MACGGDRRRTGRPTARQQQSRNFGDWRRSALRNIWRCGGGDKHTAPTDSGGEGDGQTIRESWILTWCG
ncbi:hypothetical protein KCP76_11365 [Salmonella enterica subsp. enterica serovar Weltevreden]|nr:hypothetical protein KCP76_11365 [Salmonella enterica subsp. enterica serovar Weltevreden]